MGNIDISVKNFMKINSVFAQLFEKGVYHGTVHIECDRLKELDSVNQDIIACENGNFKGFERLRDAEKITMLLGHKAAFQLIMGIEGQADIHYYMPVRCMELDAVSYAAQCREISRKARERKKLKKYSNGVPKGTKIVPVVTLIFYTGTQPWDGPMSLYDMLDVSEDMKEWLLQATPDYRINLIDARHMAKEQINEYDGDLKAFLLMLQEQFDEEQLKTALATHRETWYALSKIKKDKRYVEYINSISDKELEGGIYMDATLDYIEKRGEKRGEERGEERGEKRGEKRGKEHGLDLAARLYQLLADEDRLNDWNEAVKNKDMMMQLLREYSLITD